MMIIDHRHEQHDEERRHDQERDREEHLHRRLLRPLLGVGPPTLPELDREVPHDLARRDAHRLALCDRAGEHAHAGRVDAAEEVLERLDERQAHVLLLQRQPHLAGERLLDLRRREPERLREAETRLERDDDRGRSGRAGPSRSARGACAPCGRRRSPGAIQPKIPAAIATKMRITTSHVADVAQQAEQQPARTLRRSHREPACRAAARAMTLYIPPR